MKYFIWQHLATLMERGSRYIVGNFFAGLIWALAMVGSTSPVSIPGPPPEIRDRRKETLLPSSWISGVGVKGTSEGGMGSYISAYGLLQIKHFIFSGAISNIFPFLSWHSILAFSALRFDREHISVRYIFRKFL